MGRADHHQRIRTRPAERGRLTSNCCRCAGSPSPDASLGYRTYNHDILGPHRSQRSPGHGQGRQVGGPPTTAPTTPARSSSASPTESSTKSRGSTAATSTSPSTTPSGATSRTRSNNAGDREQHEAGLADALDQLLRRTRHPADTDLIRVDLTGADLARADLARADLAGTRFIDACLIGADLTDVAELGAEGSGRCALERQHPVARRPSRSGSGDVRGGRTRVFRVRGGEGQDRAPVTAPVPGR
ncbi:pentapeptide repeat-containing protein [Streptomyces sp. NBC_01795]|uniref:pentapeptide repeat-containing protein n=1 Tax=Streptomyces sp. NBC_01795 TaxID=2975943 RepID=UPI003FA38FD6